MPRRAQERWRPHPAGDGVDDESRDAEFVSTEHDGCPWMARMAGEGWLDWSVVQWH